MYRTIVLDDDRSVEINTSAEWFFVYKEVFGHDILPEIMPIIESVLVFMVDSFDGAENDAGNINGDTVSGLLDGLSGLEITAIYEIFWALAKAANKKIKGLRFWLADIGNIPLDTVVPQLLEAIVDGVASQKNAQRLKAFLGALAPETTSGSTTSSSEPETADSTTAQ